MIIARRNSGIDRVSIAITRQPKLKPGQIGRDAPYPDAHMHGSCVREAKRPRRRYQPRAERKIKPILPFGERQDCDSRRAGNERAANPKVEPHDSVGIGE